MAIKHPPGDVGFDGMGQRFCRNIYSTMKGRLRLAVLERDFTECLPQQALSVLDVGAGQGQCALRLTQQGHRVLLTDISAEMLASARLNFLNADLPPAAISATRWLQLPARELPGNLDEQFDLILCHAVMEWLAEPRQLLEYIAPLLRPGGYLSLIVYNLNGLIFKNLLRANYKKILRRDFTGARGSLTPLHPLSAGLVQDWLEQAGYSVVCHSGIRVFHDYVLDPVSRQQSPEDVIALELEYSRQMPFRDLGRYLHFLCKY